MEGWIGLNGDCRSHGVTLPLTPSSACPSLLSDRAFRIPLFPVPRFLPVSPIPPESDIDSGILSLLHFAPVYCYQSSHNSLLT